jgi:hypothetical protein
MSKGSSSRQKDLLLAQQTTGREPSSGPLEVAFVAIFQFTFYCRLIESRLRSNFEDRPLEKVVANALGKGQSGDEEADSNWKSISTHN